MFGGTGNEMMNRREEMNYVECKKRQQLRESNPELRELESKLRLAYINKSRQAQLAERKLIRQEEQLEKKAQREELNQRHRYDLLSEEEEAKRLRINKLKYLKVLDLQTEEKQNSLNAKYAAFLKEKKAVDELIEKIQAEEYRKKLKRMVDKQVQKDLIQQFKDSQKIWIQLEKERIEKQDIEIKKYLLEKEKRETEEKLKQKERRQLKNERVLRLAEEIHLREIQEREKEEILHELYEGRKREREELAERFELEASIKKRLQLRKSNEYAAEIRRKELEAEKAADEAFRLKIAETHAREEKLEQMNAQKRRMKQIELQREIKELMREREEEEKRRKENEKFYYEALKEEEEIENAIIEDERIKLLRSHADKLLGFLPPGILKKADLDILPSSIRQAYLAKENNVKDPLSELEKLYDIK